MLIMIGARLRHGGGFGGHVRSKRILDGLSHVHVYRRFQCRGRRMALINVSGREEHVNLEAGDRLGRRLQKERASLGVIVCVCAFFFVLVCASGSASGSASVGSG